MVTNRRVTPTLGLVAAVLFTVGTQRHADAMPANPAASEPSGVVAGVSPQRSVTVVLSEQADVSGAYALQGKQARTSFVFDRLRAVADRTQPPLVEWLETRGARVQAFYILNALSVEADDETLRLLAAMPGVSGVYPAGEVQLLEPDPVVEDEGSGLQSLLSLQSPQATEPGIRDIGADAVWRMGYEGQNIVIAVTDTGAAYKHPALKDVYRGTEIGHDYAWFDAIDGKTEPLDEHGHGTHVTGITVGKAGSRMIGVAPDARWISCRMIRDRSGPDAAALACLQWVLAPTRVDGTDPDPDMAPDVVNASWGGDQSDCDGSTSLRRAVANLQAAGIAFVTSAGNAGSDCRTICAPGSLPEAITVGNYDTQTRRIADTSSRGPIMTFAGEYIKPNVAAPGEDINSSLPPSRYGKLSGTSMSSPHVAGAVALLLSARPEFRGRPEVVQAIIEKTARSLRGDRCGPEDDEGPNNSSGYGVIDVEAAVEVALTATPPPTRTPTSTPTATRLPSRIPTATPSPSPTVPAFFTATPSGASTSRAYLPLLMR